MKRIEHLDSMTASENGFTLIEMVVAIIILTVSVLGIAASTGKVMQAAGQISSSWTGIRSRTSLRPAIFIPCGLAVKKHNELLLNPFRNHL